MSMSIMDPLPGQRYVEFSKDCHGGKKSEGESGLDSGLDIMTKHKGKIYISKVEGIAAQSGAQINPGDRIIALNGKKIESYGDLDSIRAEFTMKNDICMVTDPTLLVDK